MRGAARRFGSGRHAARRARGRCARGRRLRLARHHERVDQPRVHGEAVARPHACVGGDRDVLSNRDDHAVPHHDRATLDRLSGSGHDARAHDGVDARHRGLRSQRHEEGERRERRKRVQRPGAAPEGTQRWRARARHGGSSRRCGTGRAKVESGKVRRVPAGRARSVRNAWAPPVTSAPFRAPSGVRRRAEPGATWRVRESQRAAADRSPWRDASHGGGRPPCLAAEAALGRARCNGTAAMRNRMA